LEPHEKQSFRLVAESEISAPDICRVRVGRPPTNISKILEGMIYQLRNAGPWRDLPSEYDPWRTLYG
jgi:transposase